MKYGSFICVWYLSCVHKCPSLIRFIPDGLLKIGHLRLQNLVSYHCGRRFEKRWTLTSALVILNGSMVVNLYLLIHGRIPAKLVDLHGKSMNIFHVLLRFHTSQLMRAGFLNDQVGSIFMFGFSPLRGEDAAERDKMRQKKAVPKWCVLCLQLELLVQWWSWWDLQSNRRSLYRSIGMQCRGRSPSILSLGSKNGPHTKPATTW